MPQRTCGSCAGTGHSVTTKGSGFTRDYSTNCPTCWGTGMVNTPDPKPAGDSNAKGCFIATAAFGDYEAPEVVFLRRFRDESLSKSTIGHGFIKAYYALSPYVATYVARSQWTRKTIRRILRSIILTLRARSK